MKDENGSLLLRDASKERDPIFLSGGQAIFYISKPMTPFRQHQHVQSSTLRGAAQPMIRLGSTRCLFPWLYPNPMPLAATTVDILDGRRDPCDGCQGSNFPSLGPEQMTTGRHNRRPDGQDVTDGQP